MTGKNSYENDCLDILFSIITFLA